LADARDPLDKLRSPALRASVERSDPKPSVVIVEAQPDAVPSVDAQRNPGDGRVRSLALVSSGEPPPLEPLAKAIEGTGARVLRWLESSSSLVVEADGDQLGRVAGLPMVGAVWPN